MVGELDGIVVPCVAVSKELRMSTTSHIMLQISKLGNLNFSFGMFGDIVGARVLTEDVGVSAALFVDSLSLVSCWLFSASTIFWTNKLSFKLVLLVCLALKLGLELALNTSSTSA